MFDWFFDLFDDDPDDFDSDAFDGMKSLGYDDDVAARWASGDDSDFEPLED